MQATKNITRDVSKHSWLDEKKTSEKTIKKSISWHNFPLNEKEENLFFLAFEIFSCFVVE